MTDFSELPPEVIEAIESGHKVEAVRRLREATGLDLATAKRVIERIWRQYPHPKRAPTSRNDTGIGRLVLMLTVVGLGILAYLWLHEPS